MELDPTTFAKHHRQLTPRHWIIDNTLIIYCAEEELNARTTTKIVATVTCRDHVCVSLNFKWLAYYLNGAIYVVRDNAVLVAVLERVAPVVRIDSIDLKTGAVWFCTTKPPSSTDSETWVRWKWDWNHGIRTVTQSSVVRGPDVTAEYKQRIFTAKEGVGVCVYAYTRQTDHGTKCFVHNDRTRDDVEIGFEPDWYDLPSSSFVSLEGMRESVAESPIDEDEQDRKQRESEIDNNEEDQIVSIEEDQKQKEDESEQAGSEIVVAEEMTVENQGQEEVDEQEQEETLSVGQEEEAEEEEPQSDDEATMMKKKKKEPMAMLEQR